MARVATRGDATTETTADVVRTYQAFARLEARGRSPAYEALAEAAAADAGIVGFVAALPAAKRQPNLLFAAARYLLGVPADIASLRALVRESPGELTEVMLTRRTQTNEPARCAVLLPALAQLPEPLALVDVGASAGLTMLFDRYSYDYAGHRLAGADPDAPTLRCRPEGQVPLPDRIPAIAWRTGLDLNPLTSPATTTSAGSPAWSGRTRTTGPSGWRQRSGRRAGPRPPSSRATCSRTCPPWSPGRQPTPPWSSTTPRSCATSPRGSASSSPPPSAASASAG